MRIRLNLLGLALLALLTACGGGDASFNDGAQNRSAGIKSQGGVESDVSFKNEPEKQAELNPSEVNYTNSETTSEKTLSSDAPRSTKTLRLGSYSSYVPTGWIDDEFNRAYVFTFTGGLGASAYQPPKKPDPLPPRPSSNVGGLEAYEIPALPIFHPIPYANTWKGQEEPDSIPMTAAWNSFLYNSMACAPACTMVIADILATAPAASTSLGARPGSNQISLGDPSLDSLYWGQNPQSFGFQFLHAKRLEVLANAIDRRADRILAAWEALTLLVAKSEATTGKTEYQYALVVDRDGGYPDVRYGYVKMKALDVWKYGTSLDPDSRYPLSVLKNLGLSMVKESEGTKYQVLTQEKMQLMKYYIEHGELPPGNKIFK
ncbi:hypothetical protein [Rugamonas aquatica]|uniref:Uncharacterized protein n=1 Tax=Rugamonas aquatica TaxID=2743357 RepID=A0A6A7MYT0_9BURK|nr:hypothetical protein [Rugamonas aquatica]MQA37923.1 hypothetical protein [Rugamonas aquatica]